MKTVRGAEGQCAEAPRNYCQLTVIGARPYTVRLSGGGVASALEGKMEKRAERRESRRARDPHRVQTTNAVGEPELPPELAIFAWLLDPARSETMRRRFIDGKGGAMERWVSKYAYSRPRAPEHGIVGWRFMTLELLLQGEGN